MIIAVIVLSVLLALMVVAHAGRQITHTKREAGIMHQMTMDVWIALGLDPARMPTVTPELWEKLMREIHP